MHFRSMIFQCVFAKEKCVLGMYKMCCDNVCFLTVLQTYFVADIFAGSSSKCKMEQFSFFLLNKKVLSVYLFSLLSIPSLDVEFSFFLFSKNNVKKIKCCSDCSRYAL